MRSTLRPHQANAIAELRRAIRDGARRIIIQAPTGAGKTILAAAIVEGALAKGNRVAFTVPSISLVDQTVARFYAEGIEAIGVMQADHIMTNAARPCQVISVQTLARRKRPPADVVIVDEAHQDFKAIREWATDPAMANVPFIGLSATPWTKGLGKTWGRLIVAATTKTLIRDGWLAPYRAFACAHPDLTGVKTVAGDYHEGQLGEVMAEGGLVANVVDTWLRLGERRPTFVFSVDRAHAAKLAARFEDAGVTTGYIDCNTTALDREALRRDFEAKRIDVVCNVGVLTTGIDWDVRCIVLARPTRSEMLYVQMIGRGLRTADGKPDCLILDFSDNTLRLGLVDDVHHEALDMGKAKGPAAERKAPLPKECSSCGYLKPPKMRTCPACGHIADPVSNVKEGDGELIEVTRGAKPPKARIEDKAAWYAQLLAIAAERGYKPGWAANQYREKFGVWPRGFRDAPAAYVTDEVRRWVRSRMIAYAKAREKAAAHAG